MNIINIDLGGFVFALDHQGIFIRVLPGSRPHGPD